ncbi:hypothetical protein CLV59_109245 [Chitinophaga dinghuensis]|uniref:SUKH superfamily protein n=1 Tax=Chitinophaga dinghuensis TaxID=1539050 RepID=A0A327VWS4_9BACT|nr:hypothetical protein [Chitinophaga dinghuensis]RAJ75631.1 hypothetical protein CLV59_109245 [Chitinophaga dinghuensis]
MNFIYKFDTIIKHHSNFLYERLQEPKSEKEILKILDDLGIKDSLARTQLVELYSWKDGVAYDTTEYTNLYNFTGRGVLLPLSFVQDLYNLNGNGSWEVGTIPIFGNYKGDYLFYDTNSKSINYNMILLYSKSSLSISPMMTFYDSIESMFHTNIECFKSGAFQYIDGKGLIVDVEKMFDISRQLNPKSQYWQ